MQPHISAKLMSLLTVPSPLSHQLTLRLFPEDVPHPKQGHNLDPHRMAGIQWRAFVRGVTGSWKTAEMVLRVAELQARYGVCYASARHLASAGTTHRWSEKTWDRTLGKLRALGMVFTLRLVRPGGKLSTNIVDITELWEAFLRAEGQLRAALFRVGGDVLRLPSAWVEWWRVNSRLVLEDPWGTGGGEMAGEVV